ncbi:MAG: alpha/beta fold hydrolase [Lachnospiraceae bacterium]
MKTIFQIRSSNKISWLQVTMWEPEGDIKGILQISHGMKEHMERYDAFARYLNEKGILVVGNDHIGHGKSVQNLDELGYFPCANGKNGAETAITDLHRLTEIMKRRYGKLPYFLLGHSMGSFFVRGYLSQYGQDINGAILMATGGFPPFILQLGNFLLKGCKRILGEKYKSKMLNGALNVYFNQKFQPVKTKVDWISSDEEQVQKYLDDVRCNFDFTLNGFQVLLDAQLFIQNPENISCIPKNLPLLFVSGAEDPLGEEGKGVKKIYRTYKAAGMMNMQLKLYPGARHEILQEKDCRKVYADLGRWIGTRIRILR